VQASQANPVVINIDANVTLSGPLSPIFNSVTINAKPTKNAALTSAGADLRLAGGAVLFAKFDGEFAARSQSYVGSAGLRYDW